MGNHMAARMLTASATPSAPRAIGTTVTTSVSVAPRLLTGLWRINVFHAALRLLVHAHGNHMAARTQKASATPSAARAIGSTVTTSVSVAPNLLTGLWRISVFPAALRSLPNLRLLAH